MRQSVLRRSVVVSIVVHAGLLGLLLLLAKPPIAMDQPMRVRIVEPPPEVLPAPSGPVAAPQPVPRPIPKVARTPPSKSGSSERVARSERPGGSEGGEASVTRRPTPAPDVPAAPSPPPPPQVAARPAPEAVPPPSEPRREFRQEPLPEKSGLSLGGPPPQALAPLIARPPASRTGPSLRDQIASLGSGLTAERGGPAERTISMGDRNPRYVDYLRQLERRIYAEWLPLIGDRGTGLRGQAVLVITLNPTGTLTYIQLMESSGYPILDEWALRAMKSAAPFDPFPPQWANEPTNIIATFTYSSPYRYPR